MHDSGVLILPCHKLRGADTSDAVSFLHGRAAGRGHPGTGYLATSSGYPGTSVHPASACVVSGPIKS